MSAKLNTPVMLRWLWPVACLAVLTGYFGPWVAHPVAGLAITGLDLGEYVKFLPAVREGNITIWRQGFYLPLVVVSVTCSTLAYRRSYSYHVALRLALLMVGVIAALNLLPPAWTPAVLLAPEFLSQTAVLTLCLVMIGLSPLLALLPATPVYGSLSLVAAAAIAVPSLGFLKILPHIGELYVHDLRPGWAYYACIIGLMALIWAYWLGLMREKRRDQAGDLAATAAIETKD